MKKNQGFTLVELMIVVAIIAIIAAVAVPNLMRAKVNANETAAIGNLKGLRDAQVSYLSRTGQVAQAFSDLTTPASGPSYFDKDLSAPVSGYNYVLTPIDLYSYTADATPISQYTGTRSFHLDTGGSIHQAEGGGGATAADPVI